MLALSLTTSTLVEVKALHLADGRPRWLLLVRCRLQQLAHRRHPAHHRRLPGSDSERSKTETKQNHTRSDNRQGLNGETRV
jgi:hypothetical protein